MHAKRLRRAFCLITGLLTASILCTSCSIGEKPQHDNLPVEVTCLCDNGAKPAAPVQDDAASCAQDADKNINHKGTAMDNNDSVRDFDRANVFGKGQPNTAYAQYFIGNSYLNALTGAQAPVRMSNVTFEPGTRNNWHIHHATKGGGQMLICTAGEGWYQEFGKEPVSLTPGMVISIAPGVKHWHGAKANRWFSHISVEVPGENGRNEWLEPVSDDVYGRLPPATGSDVAGNTPVKVTAGRDALGDFAPKFAELNDDVLFGQVWSRQDKLSGRDRSLITVTALMSSGILDSSLEYHIRNAKNHGVTAEEMAEALTQLGFYAGWPKAWAAFRMAKAIYAE